MQPHSKQHERTNVRVWCVLPRKNARGHENCWCIKRGMGMAAAQSRALRNKTEKTQFFFLVGESVSCGGLACSSTTTAVIYALSLQGVVTFNQTIFGRCVCPFSQQSAAQGAKPKVMYYYHTTCTREKTRQTKKRSPKLVR